MSNSTKEGARQVLCRCRLRGVVKEIRLMAVWRAIAEPEGLSEPNGA